MQSTPPRPGPAIVIPGAPLLVPELVGVPGDPEADRLRTAVVAAGTWLGDRARTWRVVGGGPMTRPEGSGSFAGFGADVLVTAAPGGPSHDRGPDPRWPLSLLIAAWVRGISASSARIVGSEDDAEGTVFVLDGPNTLTERAPGGYRPEDAAVFAAQCDAVCEGTAADGLDADWATAAAVFRAGPVTTLYRDAPFGVGYLVATGGAV
ncbi:putative protein OS=Tsukamurella paurometabola (strain ATCC 8368 / DSM / CCUG 35730 /CIP 100753 / JCM 10117 / KCTC 9821 / NBRC 16120 / NCIMB 702349/ NCTC 13040) OX=521096 GN=Tpau_1797 PE=4 SV=1 [Tsukamurella paurometabola]|uniref:Uncharacterized protein n=1 Tax=Tsukamurella paurometabola (strain ATCC 8368 / DSM 20162 / CCUG 35730 / CIP 100753 / JCM 10117 / KCTC 9821 / NBRC 16120 / NCIMB 702349 / NCTC 13040) TaxID=521096 RepID=D5UMD5_TSUPD|nr:hypothetical protein [Tsukamurella paurometabola]ADG78415.1 conserved hypothetical protein [Tsukamurella paurometabola DSM 20162]SUP31547.1 Uncharacterised protein [Tsukamurella paurometabola]